MIKFLLMIISLNLMSCIIPPDLRPDVYSQAEGLLQLGVEAYKHDHYQRAIKHFEQAIVLYQSVADEKGVYSAWLNITNTALAYSNFSKAKEN